MDNICGRSHLTTVSQRTGYIELLLRSNDHHRGQVPSPSPLCLLLDCNIGV